MSWAPPQKPAALTETRLIQAILRGHFPIHSNLPAERELAAQLGVTRPTLREALQRLGRDGWIEIHQGKPTRVRDYYQEGTLAVLAAIANHQAGELPADFIPNLLFVRMLLAPAYTRLAIERQPQKIIEVLQGYPLLPELPDSYARFDWRVHHQLTLSSGNPVFVCFVNSLQQLYYLSGPAYFEHPTTRSHSCEFYRELLDCAHRNDAAGAYILAGRIMSESHDLWLELNHPSASPT